jgi:putative ABC transport system substrate-binding protein
MTFGIRRREFIAALGGAAAAWPLAARAQQSKLPVIGFLSNTSPEANSALLSDFRRGLQDAGYVEGRSLTIEFRWGNYQPIMPQLARELVRLQVDMIVAAGSIDSLEAATAATSTIPIVYGGGTDPVKFGFAASLNHPGGNVTGITGALNALVGKRLDLLVKLVPEETTFGYLIEDRGLSGIDELSESARVLGRQIIVLDCRTVSDLEGAFATMVQRGAGALLVGAFPVAFQNRKKVLRLAADHRFPAIYAQRAYVPEGGLISYSPAGVYRQLAIQYVARILKGEKAAELPIQLPTYYQLVINLKTARALGLTVPPTLIALADEIIE